MVGAGLPSVRIVQACLSLSPARLGIKKTRLYCGVVIEGDASVLRPEAMFLLGPYFTIGLHKELSLPSFS